MAYSYLLHMADARKVDAARSLVAKLHGEDCSVVDYEGNGFCWGWGVLGSAHPHLLQHGAIVDRRTRTCCNMEQLSTSEAPPVLLRRVQQFKICNWSGVQALPAAPPPPAPAPTAFLGQKLVGYRRGLRQRSERAPARRWSQRPFRAEVVAGWREGKEVERSTAQSAMGRADHEQTRMSSGKTGTLLRLRCEARLHRRSLISGSIAAVTKNLTCK